MRSYQGRPKLYGVTLLPDQIYSHVGGKSRLADLYVPKAANGEIPVIIWLHGGGWRFGDRHMAPDLTRFLAERGFAMVSIDYRLSDEAIFPAPVEDVKTAVRWVRSVARDLTLDGNRIGLWGSSAGGHLAACAALSSSDQFHSGEHSNYSSDVQAVVDGYGATDFSLIDEHRDKFVPVVTEVEGIAIPNLLPSAHPDSFESRLLGAPVTSSPRQVQFANPVTYVREGAPPFLIVHGRSDALMPWQQSLLLFEALQAAGNEAAMLVAERMGHGFFNNSKLDYIDPGLITFCRSSTSRAFHDGEEIEQLGFGFDVVEAFFRFYLT